MEHGLADESIVDFQFFAVWYIPPCLKRKIWAAFHAYLNKWMQLSITLVFLKYTMLSFTNNILLFISMTYKLTLVPALPLPSLPPASLLPFPCQPVYQRRCLGHGNCNSIYCSFHIDRNLWNSQGSTVQSGRKLGHWTLSTDTFNYLHRINKVLGCF